MDVEKCVSAPVASARNGDIPPVRVTGPTLRLIRNKCMIADIVVHYLASLILAAFPLSFLR